MYLCTLAASSSLGPYTAACFRVAQSLQRGTGLPTGLPQDEARADAARWLKRAAVLGHADAQFECAAEYGLEGNSKQRDLSVMWCRKAAAKGQVSALMLLAGHLASGKGVKGKGGGVVEKPLAEAAECLRKAADAGHTEAAFNLAMMFREGQGGFHQFSARTKSRWSPKPLEVSR
jgi:hypothetical protein